MKPEQKELITKYFHLLTQQFTKEEKIKLIFQDQPIEGYSYYEAGNYYATFWNNDFTNEERLFEVVVHEFTHVYFLIKEGYHYHNERFFSYVEFFEKWLRNNLAQTNH